MGDPALNITYKCTLDGIPLGIWSKIDGLGFEYTVTEYREGGVNGYTHKLLGPGKYTNLRLSRPVDEDSAILSAYVQAQLVAVLPATMSISALNAAGDEITTWNLAGVMPVKWTGPTLDIMGNGIAMETLEVAYQEIIGLGLLGAGIAGAISVSATVGF